MSRRGTCPQCGRGVYTTQARSKVDGDYYHQECIDDGADDGDSADSIRHTHHKPHPNVEKSSLLAGGREGHAHETNLRM